MSNITVVDTDNRDQNETILILSNGLRISVNPVELFQNMIENNFGPGSEPEDTSILDSMTDLLREHM